MGISFSKKQSRFSITAVGVSVSDPTDLKNILISGIGVQTEIPLGRNSDDDSTASPTAKNSNTKNDSSTKPPDSPVQGEAVEQKPPTLHGFLSGEVVEGEVLEPLGEIEGIEPRRLGSGDPTNDFIEGDFVDEDIEQDKNPLDNDYEIIGNEPFGLLEEGGEDDFVTDSGDVEDDYSDQRLFETDGYEDQYELSDTQIDFTDAYFKGLDNDFTDDYGFLDNDFVEDSKDFVDTSFEDQGVLPPIYPSEAEPDNTPSEFSGFEVWADQLINADFSFGGGNF